MSLYALHALTVDHDLLLKVGRYKFGSADGIEVMMNSRWDHSKHTIDTGTGLGDKGGLITVEVKVYVDQDTYFSTQFKLGLTPAFAYPTIVLGFDLL